MPKESKYEITIRSAAAKYLTFVSMIGDRPRSVELRSEDAIWNVLEENRVIKGLLVA